jgi:uncharacterized protein YdeI (YjbR/CyaY-like superfamily)
VRNALRLLEANACAWGSAGWARTYDGAQTSVVPEDLIMALGVAPMAKAFFSEINATHRYAILGRIETAVAVFKPKVKD